MLPAANPQQTVLRLRKFRAAEPYGSRRIYILNDKTGELKSLTTATFAVTAATAATDITRSWLSASGTFSDVFDQSVIPPGNTTTLDGWIDQACVINTDDHYHFSLKLTLWLTTPDDAQTTPQQRFDYIETYPLTKNEPAEIAAAFGETLKQALIKFEATLQ